MTHPRDPIGCQAKKSLALRGVFIKWSEVYRWVEPMGPWRGTHADLWAATKHLDPNANEFFNQMTAIIAAALPPAGERAKLITPAQMAEMFRTSKIYIYRCIERGTLRAIRTRQGWRIAEPHAKAFRPRGRGRPRKPGCKH